MELSRWLETVAARLQLELPVTDEVVRILLDLARDSAHEVERVAAPLTTFLAGVAVGRGASLPETAQAITDLLALPDPDAQDSPG